MTTIVKKRQKGDKSEVRKRILDKASEAFKVHGIKSVHMDDLAVSLGISKRTIYELFHDKEHLFTVPHNDLQQELLLVMKQFINSTFGNS